MSCDGWCGHPWCSGHDDYLIPDSFEDAILEAIGARRMTPEDIREHNIERAMESYAYS